MASVVPADGMPSNGRESSVHLDVAQLGRVRRRTVDGRRSFRGTTVLGPPSLVNCVTPNIISTVPATPGTALALFGNTPGNLMRTTDGGFSWTHLAAFPPGPGQYPLQLAYAGEPATYFAWGGYDVFRTTDHGSSWSRLPIPCNTVFALVAHPTQRDLLYASTGDTFLRSTDGGESWEAPNWFFDECMNAMPSISLAVGVNRPDVVYRGEGSTSGGGVKRSENRGNSWVDASGGLPSEPGLPGSLASVIKLVVDPRDADVVYALVEPGRVYRTIDGGSQWTLVDRGIEEVKVLNLELDSVHGTGLYAVTLTRLYSFDEVTLEWSPVPGLPYDVIPWEEGPISRYGVSFDPATPGRPLVYGELGLRIGLTLGGHQALPLVLGCTYAPCP
jgi:hypothetical protein